MRSPSGSLQHCHAGSACGAACRSKLQHSQRNHTHKCSRCTSKRWHCRSENSSHHNTSGTSHCAAMLLALGSQLLSQNAALAQQAAAEMLHVTSDPPVTAFHADRLHSTYLMDIAAQEAPALAQPNSAEAARSNDAPAPASRNQASGSSLPDPLAATTRNQEPAGPSDPGVPQHQPPPPAPTPSPAPTPTPGPALTPTLPPTPEEAQRNEEEQRKYLRKTRRSRITELQDTRAELVEKQKQLIDREKELLDKDQTVSTLREELDLERKLRGLLTKEKEKAEEQAALAMGLCTGAFSLP